MTVESDLKKALAATQAALGNYSMFAESTQDQSAKQMFQDMASDLRRHVNQIQSRLDYVSSNQSGTQGTQMR